MKKAKDHMVQCVNFFEKFLIIIKILLKKYYFYDIIIKKMEVAIWHGKTMFRKTLNVVLWTY